MKEWKKEVFAKMAKDHVRLTNAWFEEMEISQKREEALNKVLDIIVAPLYKVKMPDKNNGLSPND